MGCHDDIALRSSVRIVRRVNHPMYPNGSRKPSSYDIGHQRRGKKIVKWSFRSTYVVLSTTTSYA